MPYDGHPHTAFGYLHPFWDATHWVYGVGDRPRTVGIHPFLLALVFQLSFIGSVYCF